MGKKKGKKKDSSYLSPGVYLEELPIASRPIESVGTSVAAFVGVAPFNLRRAAATTLVLAVAARALGSRSAH